MKTKTDKIGVITLGSKVHVSDPCYATDCWCAGTLENVLPGQYKCKVVRCNDNFNKEDAGFYSRVKSIIICHEDYKCTPKEKTAINVGVDSGQAGFYDLDYYRDVHPSEPEHLTEEWYERVCESTLKSIHNPQYISEKDYVRNVMGTRFMELHAIHVAESKGTLTTKQAQELRDLHMHTLADYRNERHVQWETIQIGHAGILDDCCCVASSGYGDGSYACFVARNDTGQIVAAKIEFI